MNEVDDLEALQLAIAMAGMDVMICTIGLAEV